MVTSIAPIVRKPVAGVMQYAYMHYLTKSFDQHRLACPTLSCDDIQARPEHHMLLFHQGKVPAVAGQHCLTYIWCTML